MKHFLIFQDNTETVELTEPRYTIGRSQSCDIVIDRQEISRIHAFIALVDKHTYSIHDGSPKGKLSKNGIFVKRGEEHWKKQLAFQLQHGDCVMLSFSTIFKYSVFSDEINDGTLSGTVS